MAFNQTESVTDDIVKTEFEEISVDDLDIDLNLTQSESMDWKLNSNVECKVTLEKLYIPPFGNGMHDLRDSEKNVHSVQSYSKFKLLVDELSNFVDKCEEKCSDCEEYIHLLQNHIIQTHGRRSGRSCTANGSQERTPVTAPKNGPSSLTIISNQDDEKKESRMSETPSRTQDIGIVESLIIPEVVTLEHMNHISTIAVKQIPDYNLYDEDPLLNLEVKIPSGYESQLTDETEQTGTHARNSDGNIESTLFTSSGTALKPFECSTCGKSFTANSSLTRHKLNHKGESRFKCDVCGKYFASSDRLIRHQRTHTGIKPFRCSTCEKCFGIKSSLSRHELTHTGGCKLNCEVCGKSFAFSSALIQHERTHTGEKPFSCDVCGQSFTRNESLTRHKIIHTGKKPFKCDVCGFCSAFLFKLKYHKRRRNH